MKNKQTYGKVSNLPFISGLVTKEKIEEIRKLDWAGKQPMNMDYRIQFMKGYGASTRDKTWSRSKHIHTCCLSKVAWRHKASCKKVTKPKDYDDYSDLKDI